MRRVWKLQWKVINNGDAGQNRVERRGGAFERAHAITSDVFAGRQPRREEET